MSATTMGIISSLVREARPPKSHYNPEKDVPDLSGKVVIVTGGNTGIGYEIVKQLLEKDATVYVAARDEVKTHVALQKLHSETGRRGLFLHLDLADLEGVRTAAENFKTKESKLHLLFNNAGVSEPPIWQVTKQSIDMQWGVNVLGHYYFTRLLLPTLLAGAKSSDDGKARIVNLASSSHLMTSGLCWDTFEDGPARQRKSPMELYNQSKFGNVVLSHELARRYGDQGIVSTALNPGLISSELQRHYGGLKNWVLHTFLLWPTEYGALTPLYAGTAPEGKDFNGKYLIPWARLGNARNETHDRETGERLWNWLEGRTKGY